MSMKSTFNFRHFRHSRHFIHYLLFLVKSSTMIIITKVDTSVLKMIR